jgi:hypothetical protein
LRGCALLVNMKIRLSWKLEALKDRREADSCEVNMVPETSTVRISVSKS